MISRRSLLSQGLWLACGLGGAWLLKDKLLWPAPKAQFAPEVRDSGWLPFASSQFNSPTARVQVNGEEVTALLDSGAQRSVIDAALARKLKLDTTMSLPVIASGLGGGAQVGRGTSADVQVGAMVLSAVRLTTLGLGSLADSKGLGTPLVLGQDVLRAVVAEIDFPGRRLRLCDPARYRAPADARLASSRMDGGALVAPVRVNGAPVEPIVDTGASLVLSVTEALAATLNLAPESHVRAGSSLVLGGVMPTRVVRADTVAFAGQVYQDALIDVFPGQKLPGFPTAVLGVEAMRDLLVVLDLGQGRLHVADRSPATSAAPVRPRYGARRRRN